MEIYKKLNNTKINELVAIMQEEKGMNLVDIRTYKEIKIGVINNHPLMLDEKGNTPKTTLNPNNIKLFLLAFRADNNNGGIVIKINKGNEKQYSIHPAMFLSNQFYIIEEKSRSLSFERMLNHLDKEISYNAIKDKFEAIQQLKAINVSKKDITTIKGDLAFNKSVYVTTLTGLEQEMEDSWTNMYNILEDLNEIYFTHSLHTAFKQQVDTIESVLNVALNIVQELQTKRVLIKLLEGIASIALNPNDPRLKALNVKDLNKLNKLMEVYDL